MRDGSMQPGPNLTIMELVGILTRVNTLKDLFLKFEEIEEHSAASSKVQDVAMELITQMHDLASQTKLNLALNSSKRLNAELKIFLPEAVGKLGRYYSISYEPLDPENPPKTVQLHGSILMMRCNACNTSTHFKRELFIDENASPPIYVEQIPRCGDCTDRGNGKRVLSPGAFRLAIQLYNEPVRDMEQIAELMTMDKDVADLFIVVGTSLTVVGAQNFVKMMCTKAKDAEEREILAIWINPDSPPRAFEECFVISVNVTADEVAEAWREEAGIWASSDDAPFKGIKDWPSSDSESGGQPETDNDDSGSGSRGYSARVSRNPEDVEAEGTSMTAYLKVTYLKPIKTPQTVLITSILREVKGRKVFVDGTITDSEGAVLAKGESLFLTMTRERIREKL
jgi:NAD-dependent SIR2 family protein deacetylase